MAGLEDLLRDARSTPEHNRAKTLAKSDYKLLADLVKVRKENQLDQGDVAAILGISQQAISKLESYDSDPKLSTLRRYANAIGAFVEHTVVADKGHLEAHKVWISASYSEVRSGPGATVSDRTAARRTYAAATSRILDFALAA